MRLNGCVRLLILGCKCTETSGLASDEDVTEKRADEKRNEGVGVIFVIFVPRFQCNIFVKCGLAEHG